MKRCTVCGRVTVWSSFRAADGEIFCSAYCLTYSPMPGFCEKCVAETTDEPVGNTTMTGFGGSMLLGRRGRCDRCHSIVQRRVYFALFVPMWGKARWRVLYTDRTHYVGRRLKPPADAAVVPR